METADAVTLLILFCIDAFLLGIFTHQVVSDRQQRREREREQRRKHEESLRTLRTEVSDLRRELEQTQWTMKRLAPDPSRPERHAHL